MEKYHEVSPGGDLVLNLYSHRPGPKLPSTRVRNEHNDEGPGSQPPKPSHRIVQIRVSSFYLSCALSFADLPRGELRPCIQLPEDSSVGPGRTSHVCLKNDDPTAMLLLMKILHGQFDKVDKVPNVDSNTLWEFAILLDQYKVQNNHAKVCYSKWRQKGLNLRDQDTTGALLYFCLSWLFRDECLFYDLSRHLILESRSRITTDLPIPEHFRDRIEEKRCLLLTDIFDQLRAYLSLRGGNPVASWDTVFCSRECDTRVWFGLTRGLRSLDLYPFPELPYDGLSANDTLKRIREMPLPTLEISCGSINSRALRSVEEGAVFHESQDDHPIGHHHCSAVQSLKEMLNAALDNCEGLCLQEFTS